MEDEELSRNIEYLKSTDLDKVRDAIRKLGYSGDKKVIPILMDMLVKEKNIRLKNALALSLGDLRANEAVPLLMELIKDPEYKNKRGSFVYALQELDCKKYLLDIVDLICTGDYEVYHISLDIFELIVDDANFTDKLLAKEKLNSQEQVELAMPPSKHPEYDRIHFIKDALRSLED